MRPGTDPKIATMNVIIIWNKTGIMRTFYNVFDLELAGHYLCFSQWSGNTIHVQSFRADEVSYRVS